MPRCFTDWLDRYRVRKLVRRIDRMIAECRARRVPDDVQ